MTRWMIERHADCDESWYVYRIVNGYMEIGESGRSRYRPEPMTEEEARATAERFNAREAGPELLKALKAIMARVEGRYDDPYLQAFGPLGSISHDVYRLSYAAIAKAEGR